MTLIRRARKHVDVRDVLHELENRSRYFGSLIGVAAGEPYYVREALKRRRPGQTADSLVESVFVIRSAEKRPVPECAGVGHFYDFNLDKKVTI